jgi:hypothetical protein
LQLLAQLGAGVGLCENKFLEEAITYANLCTSSYHHNRLLTLKSERVREPTKGSNLCRIEKVFSLVIVAFVQNLGTQATTKLTSFFMAENTSFQQPQK